MAVERWPYQPIRRGGSHSWALARALTALLVLLGAAVVWLVVWQSDPGSKGKLDANTIASPFDVSGGPPPCPPPDAIKVTDLARSAVAATAPTAGGQVAPRSYSRIHSSHRLRWRSEPIKSR